MLRVAAMAAAVALSVMLWCTLWAYVSVPPSDHYDENGPIPVGPLPWPTAHPVESGLLAGGLVLVLGAAVVAIRSD